ncbi:SOS response-associated peptidase [Faecalicatena contorta]|uniref:SOS response-associated peptidase n=1 Tax=Faecalicatena contorta TaxID=39482 RepID=UPI001F1C47E9|nr:SOS response-associated peptidase family protein [Faecalicatena contorta]MCF2554365.1 SOS response-associated peptidase family protein [Faecalicatena contorta]
MCGRYYVDEETANEIKRIINDIDKKLNGVKMGEIKPAQNALVLTGKKTALSAEFMQWGFPRFDNKGLIINARAESVKEKRAFKESVMQRRCIIPAAHYFEWDRSRTKTTLSRCDSGIVYMAGIYQYIQNVERFVILTTQANPSVIHIHDRMPLILEEKEIERWVYDNELADYLLRKVPVQLKTYQEFTQQCLNFQ